MDSASFMNWFIGEHGWVNRSRMIDTSGRCAPKDQWSYFMNQWYPEYGGIPEFCLFGSNTAMRWLYNCKRFTYSQEYIYPDGQAIYYIYTFEAYNRLLKRKYNSQVEMLRDICRYRADEPDDKRQQMSFYRRTALGPAGNEVFATGPRLIVSFKSPWDKIDYKNMIVHPMMVNKSIMFNLDMGHDMNDGMWYHRLEGPDGIANHFTATIGPDKLVYTATTRTGVVEINTYERTPWEL